MSRAKKVISRVVGKLKKASKAHANQAKSLESVKLKKGKSTVNKAGNYSNLL